MAAEGLLTRCRRFAGRSPGLLPVFAVIVSLGCGGKPVTTEAAAPRKQTDPKPKGEPPKPEEATPKTAPFEEKLVDVPQIRIPDGLLPVTDHQRKGDILVSLFAARMVRPQLFETPVKGRPLLDAPHEYFDVTFRVENSGKSSVRLNSWSHESPGKDKQLASLTDDAGRRYKQVTFLPNFRIIGVNIKAVAISNDPDDVDTESLVFESPKPGFKYLDVALPAENCGLDGVFYFRIPADKITRN